MDVAEQNRKEFLNFKNNTTLFGAVTFNCKKCKDLWASLTQMQEPLLENRCYKYCDQTFASRTDKLNYKKYMCKQCEIIFSHSVELHISTKKIYGECNSKSNTTGSSPL